MEQSDKEQVVNNIMRWLADKHTTLWGGDGWTVTKSDGQRGAALWFYAQMESFYDWMDEHEEEEGTSTS